MAIPAELRAFIAERDRYRCTYCLTAEENCGLQMHIDHIIPEVVGGESTLENLCLICFSCNVHKGAKQTGRDPVTQQEVSLFHPVLQTWHDHFTWNENSTYIISLTPIGRATVIVLHMNNSIVVQARTRWVSAGWHPPT